MGMVLAIPVLRHARNQSATSPWASLGRHKTWCSPTRASAVLCRNQRRKRFAVFGLDVSGADRPPGTPGAAPLIRDLRHPCRQPPPGAPGPPDHRRALQRTRRGGLRGRVFRTKLIAFALSGALAGLAGVLISFQYQSAVFSAFDPSLSLLALAWIVIGGLGYVFGTIDGAIVAPGRCSPHRPALGGLRHLATDHRRRRALLAVRFNANGIAHQQNETSAGSQPTHETSRPTRVSWSGDPDGNRLLRVPAKRLRISDLTIRTAASSPSTV